MNAAFARASAWRYDAGRVLGGLALAGLLLAPVLLVPRGDDPRLRTPGGAREALLVREVAPEQAVAELDDVLRVVDGAGAALDAPPDLALLEADRPELESGWIAFTHFSNRGAPLRSFKTTWRVPPAPRTQRRQTIFLFNGLQNDGPNHGILQPVLQWGVSAAGGGPYWSVASWYVTARGQAFHTPLVRVEPAQLLTGEMTLVEEGRGRHSYASELRGIPRTRLLVKNLRELFWATESLEAYGITRCSDYPADSGVPFTEISLRSDGPPPLRWQAVDRVTDCGQHATVRSHSPTSGHVEIGLRARVAE